MSNNPIVNIEKANVKDLDNIYEYVCLLENTSFDKAVFGNIFAENSSNKYNFYFVARVENNVVGFISCHCQYLLHHCGLVGEIQELFVIESYRNIGIGKKLIEFLKSILLERSIHQLEVTSNIKRKKASLFYEKLGFKNTHRKFVANLK